jgi:hypothetical protein
MSNEDWEDLNLKAASMICLCLAKDVLANIYGISAAKELLEKLEELYQTKGLSNRLYLNEQFDLLRMDAGMKISYRLSVLNVIVSELEAIGVEIDDEDNVLWLIWSLSSTCGHIKPILMYGKISNSMRKKATCWNCGQTGHVKRNCPNCRAGSANCFGSDNASLLVEEDVDVVL